MLRGLRGSALPISHNCNFLPWLLGFSDSNQSGIRAGNGWVKVGNAFCLILTKESEVKSRSLSSRSFQEIFCHSLEVDGGGVKGCLSSCYSVYSWGENSTVAFYDWRAGLKVNLEVATQALRSVLLSFPHKLRCCWDISTEAVTRIGV